MKIYQSVKMMSSQNVSSPPPQTNPSLSVSDPVGIEFLTKSSNSPPQSAENTPKSNKEEFTFFKPSEEPNIKENINENNMNI